MPKVDTSKRLEPLDNEHFYLDGVMIDINQISYQFNTIKRPWGHGHMMAQLIGNVRRTAEYLNKHKCSYEGLPDFAERSIRKLKEYGFKIW